AAVADRAVVHTVVVADSCVDTTEAIAKSYEAAAISVAYRNVGAARAAGVTVGLGVLGVWPLSRTWLASTDADTVVPSDWLARQLDLADAGVTAVAGVVRVDSFSDHPSGTAQAFDALYGGALHLGHSHVHGANIGTRADAYQRAGGWGELHLAEDHDLWRRLREVGERCLATTSLSVITSGRALGRADGGFADLLTGLLGET
ncbi:MAG: glycosyltransferase, partial [Acidimicrobiales bacterium]